LQLYEQYQYAQAVKHFDNAKNRLSKNDDLAMVYHYRGLCYRGLERPNEAISDLKQAVRLCPYDMTFVTRLKQVEAEIERGY
jgi:tetratricopeptide (TPR) repeat protein